MRVAKCFPGALAALLICGPACAGTAFVNFGSQAQAIEGFGGATAWMPQLTTTQANALFSNGSNQQIGLSILRVRIDPAGSGNWGTELANAQAARARGAIVIATPWTPPASMKTNNNVVGGMLQTSSYAAFATYLESFVNFFASSGVPLSAISMQNEPDANVTYESCSWTGTQMDTWVANNAGTLTIPLMMPESESFTTSFSDPALNDSRALPHIGFIAGHIYGVSPQPYPNAVSKGKQVWMTEHYLTSTGISGALQVAKEINDSMSVANYNAYVWWWVEDWPAESFSFGLIDANANVKPTGAAMGQYSKFIRPGYVRFNSTYNPSPNVFVTAYAGNNHHVIVAINTGTAAVNQPFTLQGATVTSLTPTRTSSSQNLAQLGAVAVSNNAFTYSLPGQSITTFAN
jgi:glucuronoarabinoxylan endo-1,4-beta-xylanase